MAVIEFSRNVCGIKDANTSEIEEDKGTHVIHLMESQKNIHELGGTMRLGAYPCIIKDGTLARRTYNRGQISERHRHRFEVNNQYRKNYEEKGMNLSGLSPDGELVEIMELEDHPWFLGCQFHPEFKSTPLEPHPLFSGFIHSALEYKS